MKLIFHLLAVIVLAAGLAVSGARLYFEGGKRFAEYKAKFPDLSDGPDFGVFREKGWSSIRLDPYMFHDPATGSQVYFLVPTIGFGQFLMLASALLLGFGIGWLLTMRGREPGHCVPIATHMFSGPGR